MVSSKAVSRTLKLINFRSIVYKQFKNPKRNTKALQAAKFDKSLRVQTIKVDGVKVLTVLPKKALNKHIIFLHGGAYIIEASAQHRKIIENFAQNYQFKVSFIDYPKAPENTYITTHKVLLEAYLELTKQFPGDEFYLFGDSAGGGLALAFLEQLIDKGIAPLPLKTVLVSPWLDASMENEQIKKFEDIDPILSIESLRYAGEKYAGNKADMKNPMVSPIYGNLSNFGKLKIYVGTNELFYPDCNKLAEISLSKEGTSVNLTIVQDMLHDWIVFPIKESQETIQDIAKYLLEE